MQKNVKMNVTRAKYHEGCLRFKVSHGPSLYWIKKWHSYPTFISGMNKNNCALVVVYRLVR